MTPPQSSELAGAAQCAAYLGRVRPEWASPAVEHAGRLSLLDWLGAAAHGLQAGGPRGLMRALALGDDVDRWPPGSLALVLGTAGYAHEAEQSHEASGMHVSTPIWPLVVEVVAREARTFTAQEVCAAFSAAFEVGAAVGRVAHPRASAAGWHTTPVIGAISATAAGAALLGLGARETEQALGLAASLAGGTQAMYATPGLALATGHAAWLGWLALRLVAAGVRGPDDALSGRRSLIAAITGDDDALAAPVELHEPPDQVLDNRFKAYPAALLTHSAIEATTQLVTGAPLVEGFRVRVSPLAGSIVDRPEYSTPEEARFSVQWAVREASSGRDLWTGSDAVHREEIPVAVEVDPDLPRYGTEVTACYEDGTTRTLRVELPRGLGDRPLPADAIVERFHAVVGRLIGAAAARELSRSVLTAQDLEALRIIGRIVRCVHEEEE